MSTLAPNLLPQTAVDWLLDLRNLIKAGADLDPRYTTDSVDRQLAAHVAAKKAPKGTCDSHAGVHTFRGDPSCCIGWKEVTK